LLKCYTPTPSARAGIAEPMSAAGQESVGFPVKSFGFSADGLSSLVGSDF